MLEVIHKYWKGIIGVLVLLLVLVVIIAFKFSEKNKEEINSFEECITAGYPIMESYPRRCMTPDGESFTEEIPYPLNPES